MDKDIITTVTATAKQMGRQLEEVLRLTRELKDAAERNDQVSMKLILAERGEALDRLQVSDRVLGEMPGSARTPEEERQIAALLRGEDTPGLEDCAAAAERIRSNRRIYEQIMDLDRRLRASMPQ